MPMLNVSRAILYCAQSYDSVYTFVFEKTQMMSLYTGDPAITDTGTCTASQHLERYASARTLTQKKK